jgi:UPF0716 protein FxsA
MPVLLVLLFAGVPLLELVVILQVGAAIGGWPTAGLLLAASIVGAWLLRVEGRRAWSEFRSAMAEGRWPGDEVTQGALIIVGGTLLVTPGFVTDAVGFLLLLAPTRRLIASRVRVSVGARSRVAGGADGRTGRGTAAGGDVGLDVEVVEIEREQRPLEPPPGGGDHGGGREGPDAPGTSPGPDPAR